MSTKTLDDFFTDWEAHVFGLGYGSGEPHTIPALSCFLEACTGENGSYDYTVLAAALGPVVTWLLINTLGHADIIEYGTSPRFGWLTGYGKLLRRFVVSKTDDDLIALTGRDSEYIECFPDHCNCDGDACVNPFWRPRPRRARNATYSS